jgi:hypothetical protein
MLNRIAEPCREYLQYVNKWRRCRDACGGLRAVLEHDLIVSVDNYLLPFSPSMHKAQYQFYQAESEYPGIVTEYAKMLVGGLIRKQPQITLPDGISQQDRNWLLNSFGRDGCSLSAFLSQALWEEVLTSRAWVFVDLPSAISSNSIRPYPVIWTAESVINWKYSIGMDDRPFLEMVMVMTTRKVPDPTSEFHTLDQRCIEVHRLVNGVYVVERYIEKPVENNSNKGFGSEFVLEGEQIVPKLRGEVLNRIPAWPLSGKAEMQEPILLALVDRELALYNKLSRRNHLLYCASTYTPVVFTDDEDGFNTLVDAGLGSFVRLGPGDNIKVLDTPTAALKDLENAVAATLGDMAKMGIRMLAPENSQSGVALDIRSAGQVAKLASMNTQISSTLSSILAYMLTCSSGRPVMPVDVPVLLSADFDPSPLGAEWLRLVTEWYEKKLIPRELWLNILKVNDIVPAEYDDVIGKVSIDEDELIPKI